MISKKDNYSKEANYQENLNYPSKLPYYLNESPELFTYQPKANGGDHFDGKINNPPNLSNKINSHIFDNIENFTTKDITNEILQLFKNCLEDSNFSKEENDKSKLFGKKITKDKIKEKKEEKEEKDKKDIVKKSEKTELKKNQDNYIKASSKALFFFLIVLIENIGNIKLNSINLRKFIGGVKKNKIVFKLKLYQILCCDKDRKNKQILDNAQPKDELLYYYFLTRTYRFLFNHYYEGKQIFAVNGENILVPLFPTFDKVLEIRNKKYYKDYPKPLKEKVIEEFKRVSELVYNNFENCERKRQYKKIFFTVETPKIEDIENNYNRIIRGNNFFSFDNYSNLEKNKEPINFDFIRNFNLSLDKNSEENKFSYDKKQQMDNDFNLIEKEEDNKIKKNIIFDKNENKFMCDSENLLLNSIHENQNIFTSFEFNKEKEKEDEIILESNYDNYIDNNIIFSKLII